VNAPRAHRAALFTLDAVLLTAAVISVIAVGLGWVLLPALAIVVTLVAGARFHHRFLEAPRPGRRRRR
jgi:hypothetical protein